MGLIFLPLLNRCRAKEAGKLEGLRVVLLVIASVRRTQLRTTNVCVVESAALVKLCAAGLFGPNTWLLLSVIANALSEAPGGIMTK